MGDRDGWITIANEHDGPLLQDMLGPYFGRRGNAVLLNTYTFERDTGCAMLEFDLFTIGNREAHDEMRLFVNGQMIDATRLAGGSITTVSDDGLEATLVSYNFIERESVTRDVTAERLTIAAAWSEVLPVKSTAEAYCTSTISLPVFSPLYSISIAPMAASGPFSTCSRTVILPSRSHPASAACASASRSL